MTGHNRSASCNTCNYGVHVKDIFSKEVECHRYPPQLVMVGQQAMGVGSYKWKPAWPNVPLDGFCGEYVSEYIDANPKPEIAVEKYDVKKWNILKDVDAEVSSAVDVVRAIDPTMEAELAEKFLLLNDKAYLQPLVEVLEAGYREKVEVLNSVFAVGDGLELDEKVNLTPGLYGISEKIKIRILPDQSVMIIENSSGPLSEYIKYNGIEEFCRSNFINPLDLSRI